MSGTAEGITLRKLTMIRDRLQAERNQVGWTIDSQERYRMTAAALFSQATLDRAIKDRAQLTTAIQEVDRAINGLASILTRNWFYQTPGQLLASVLTDRKYR
jgi:hypothetical protein